MSTKKNSAISKIHTAEMHWHNTVGEYLLRYGGIFLALSILVIGLKYGYDSALFTSNHGAGYAIKHGSERTGKTVLFVTLNFNESYSNEANILKEAIASYHGVKILNLQGSYKLQNMEKENQIVFVMGSREIDNVPGLLNLMKKVADRNIPLFWLGKGFSQVAHIFDIPFSGEKESDKDDLSLTPPKSYLTYKGTEIAAEGLPITRGNLKDFAQLGEVLGSVKLHGTFSRAALIRHGDIIYSAFSPLSQSYAPFVLPIIMDSLSLLIGKHKPNPRVIFRLEDINSVNYNEDDSSFRKTVDYLVGQDVYVHMGIIPTMVDAEGKVLAHIDEALPVLEFVKQNPDHVGIIQHGYKHWRKDPRNKGMRSGDAFEFFLDDDQTMGVRASRRFATNVIKEGYTVMLENGLTPYMFEAPHYVMSPAQQTAAEKMFSLMQHKPLFPGERLSEFFLPWLTQRNTTVYTPSSAGYVDALTPKSVNNILYSLEIAAKILPDPIVVVFFHPFMKEFEGRENDLEKLVRGIKGLNYRFVNMMDEVEPITAAP